MSLSSNFQEDIQKEALIYIVRNKDKWKILKDIISKNIWYTTY